MPSSSSAESTSKPVAAAAHQFLEAQLADTVATDTRPAEHVHCKAIVEHGDDLGRREANDGHGHARLSAPHRCLQCLQCLQRLLCFHPVVHADKWREDLRAKDSRGCATIECAACLLPRLVRSSVTVCGDAWKPSETIYGSASAHVDGLN